ncbi:helix-turn-helix domain-containing protein [Nitratidesulfovibrio liaohensis]|uniref:helix-turn-helix domain-containing protein n=1 Tax=Nitratidesulfovibrio liaohensis TaxID=2604158 RepID=UPI0038CD5DE7
MGHDALGRSPSGLLGPDAFPLLDVLPPKDNAFISHQNPFAGLSSLPGLRAAAEALVVEAMRRAGGVQKFAATILGITPQALRERLRRG